MLTGRSAVLISVSLLFLCFPLHAGAMSGSDNESEIFHPTITMVKGVVTVKGAKYPAWEEAREGMLLLSGDTLRTGGNGYARVEFPSGELELYETAVLVVPTVGVQQRKKDIREVIINEGKALFDINPLGVERGFNFRTKNIQGGVKGTLFSVCYVQDGSTVNVYRGVVQVSGFEGTGDNRAKLMAGETLRVENGSEFGRVNNFDPSKAIEDYSYNVPPGLDEKGLPADYNANPDNKGVRSRGRGVGTETAPGQNK